MTDPLFLKDDLRATIGNQGRGLAKEINSLSEAQILNTSQEEMLEYLIEKHRINPLEIDESNIQMDYSDAQIDVSRDFRRVVFNRSTPFYIAGTRVTFYVPFTGDSELFHCQPSTHSLNPPRAIVRSNELVFTYSLTNDRMTQVKELFEEELDRTKAEVGRVKRMLRASTRL